MKEDISMIYYFAYGSNMSEEHMRGRLGREIVGEKGVLKGFELIFNKQADIKPGRSYANIINKEGTEVQGAIHRISEEELKEIDKNEGYPEHYNRIILNIKNEDGTEIPCVVYIANCFKTKPGLKPEKEYLERLLAGKKFMSENYFEWLIKVDTYGK